MSKTKLIVIILVVLALILVILFSVQKRKTSDLNNAIKTSNTVNNPLPKPQKNYSTEEEKIVLNFKDNQVVMKGRPLISKDYVKIFHFVYLGMGGDEDAFILNEVSTDQQGSYSYKLSGTQNRIFTGVGKDSNGKPIKQSMEIIPLENLTQISQNCQITDKEINGLSVKTIDCPDFSSPACYVPIDEKSAIFYKQESEEKMPDSNMCENLEKNGVFSISFQKY